MKELVEYKLRQICEWYKVEIKEMNIQKDHVHLLLSIPPKHSVKNPDSKNQGFENSFYE